MICQKLLSEQNSILLSLVFYIALVVLYFIIAAKFLLEYRKNKGNKINMPLAIMFLFLGIGRIFCILYDYYYTKFDLELKNDYLAIWKVGNMFVLGGFGFLLLIVSGLLFRKKAVRFVIMAGYTVPIVLILASTNLPTAQGWVMPAFIFWAVIPIGYIYIGKNSTGSVRKKAIFVVVGVLIYLASSALLAEFITSLLSNSLPFHIQDIHTISSIGKFIGITFIVKGYL